MRISVCIGTYNQAPYIRDCLLSVLSQQVAADVEIIVGDDASTDETHVVVQEVLDQHPGRLKYLRRAANVGAAENYRDMVRMATGDYIAHLDGDDYWLPGKLAQQLAFMLAHPQCAAVYCNAFVVTANGDAAGVFNNAVPPVFDLSFLLAKGNFLNLSSILYCGVHKGAVTEIAGEFIDYRIHLRLAATGPLGYVPISGVVYRLHSPTSMIRTVPDRVRRLYWDCLKDALATPATANDSIKGSAHFLASLVIGSIWRGEFAHAAFWTRTVMREAGASAAVIVFRAMTIASWQGSRRAVQKIATRRSAAVAPILFVR